MAVAIKCDRCGKLCEPYITRPGYEVATLVQAIETKAYDTKKHSFAASTKVNFELCKECAGKFSDWMEQGAEENEDDRTEEESGDSEEVETEP